MQLGLSASKEMRKIRYALFFNTTSAVLFSEGTLFSSHNKSALASAAAKFQRNEQGEGSLHLQKKVKRKND
jgi:hypothetical protein